MNSQKKINNSQAMEILKEKLTGILKIIPSGSKIIYAEYPVYENIGDLLIMKGTEKFFKDNQIEVVEKYNYNDFPLNLKLASDTIIVMQGGGNFGDLYIEPQSLRDRIVKMYPLNKIVLLPQTVEFKNSENEQDTFKLYKEHKNLHFFAREKRTYEKVENNLENLYLFPDMAHQLWPLETKVKKSVSTDILLISRTDGEKNMYEDEIIKKLEKVYYKTDWPKVVSNNEKIIIKIFVKIFKLNSKINNKVLRKLTSKLWDVYSSYLINKAIKLFNGYNHIVTSRLHGHILALLLNKNNTFINNSYSKNSEYYKAWSNISDITYLEETKSND